MSLDNFEIQSQTVQVAIEKQLLEGKVVILAGEGSESAKVFHSQPEKFDLRILEDGSTAYYLKIKPI